MFFLRQPSSRECFDGDCALIKREEFSLNKFVSLVSFAREQNKVSRERCLDRVGNRPSAVQNDFSAREIGMSFQDLFDDCGRLFVSGVIVGYDRIVGIFHRDFAHGRALERVTVATASEDKNQAVLLLDQFSCRREQLF